MDDFGSITEGLINQFGQTFLLGALLPMLLLVGVNVYILFPGQVDLFPQVGEPLLGLLDGPLLSVLVLALFLAILLMVVNRFIIRLFEGYFWGAREVLMRLPYAGKLRQYQQRYASIEQVRAQRREMLQRYEISGDYDAEADFALQDQLDKLHQTKEARDPLQRLPYERRRLMPTAFGNAWAIIEEYPSARYGMDGTLFWPYLRTVILKENPALIGQIDGAKMLVDLSLNFALAVLIIAAESLLLAGLRLAPGLLALSVAGLALYVIFYRAAVSFVGQVGLMVTQAYDLYRLPLLDALDVARPDDLDEEYWVWTRLAAFIRRGESFYFDMLDRARDEESEDEDGDDGYRNGHY